MVSAGVVGTPKAGRKALASRNNTDNSATQRISSTKAASDTLSSSASSPSPASYSENRNPKPRTPRTPASETPKPARSPVRRPQTTSSGTTNGAGHNGLGEQSPIIHDETPNSKTATALEELQQRVLMAETAASEYQKQTASLQKQLSDAQASHVEHKAQSKTITELETLAVDSAKALEVLHDKHKSDQAEAKAREDALEQEIAQLKASDHGSLQRELAEAHVRIVELENRDNQHIHDLETTIVELKMTNARLMEECDGGLPAELAIKPVGANFGGAVDLSGKQRAVSASQAVVSSNAFAEELGLPTADATNEPLLLEIAALREQNKALSLYLNNIVSRILQHAELDGILDKDPDLLKGSEILAQIPAETASTNFMSSATGFLQRTKSMMSAGGSRPVRPTFAQRSDSLASSVMSPNENPETAPRIPLAARNGQRPTSIAPRRGVSSDGGPAPIGTAGLRGRSPSKTVMSPETMSPPSATFPTARSRRESGSRAPSGSTFQTIGEGDETIIAPSKRDSKIASSRNSMMSEAGASDTSSPPRSNISGGSNGEKPSGAIIMGSKPRPLRLVREAAEQDEASRKAANRASWMGWFNKGPQAMGP